MLIRKEHTIEGVDDCGLAHGSRSFRRRVANVVPDLGTTGKADIGVNLVRLGRMTGISTMSQKSEG